MFLLLAFILEMHQVHFHLQTCTSSGWQCSNIVNSMQPDSSFLFDGVLSISPFLIVFIPCRIFNHTESGVHLGGEGTLCTLAISQDTIIIMAGQGPL